MAPDSESPRSKSAVIAALRDLASRRPATRDGLHALEQESVQLALQLRREAVLDVPHEVWHFLSDGDVRFKDEQYAVAQTVLLESVLSAWEREAPSNTSLERSRDG